MPNRADPPASRLPGIAGSWPRTAGPLARCVYRLRAVQRAERPQGTRRFRRYKYQSTTRHLVAQGRIQSLLNGANETDRKKLEGEIAKRWTSVQAVATVDGLRKFVALYGPISASGKAARLKLAEQLLATGDSDDLTEAERVLATLCLAGRERRDDPLAAGRATDLMIRVCLRRGRYENAVGYCRQLAEEFPDVPVRRSNDRPTNMGRDVHRQAVPPLPGNSDRHLDRAINRQSAARQLCPTRYDDHAAADG